MLSLSHAPEHQYLLEGTFYRHMVPYSLQLLPRVHLLTAWLGRPGELIYLVPWDCNNQCHSERSLYLFLMCQFLWMLLGAPLHCLALVVSGAYVHGSHRIATSGERVLKQLPHPGHSKRLQI